HARVAFRLRSDGDTTMRHLVLISLALLASPAAAQSPAELIKQLADADPQVRARAAVALGEKKDPVAIEPLVRALGDRAEEVSQAARQALRGIGAKAVPALTKALESDVVTARTAAGLLGELGKDAKPAVGALAKALTDRDVDLRIHAAHA